MKKIKTYRMGRNVAVLLFFFALISFSMGFGKVKTSENNKVTIGAPGTISGRVIYKGGHVRKIENVIKDENSCGHNDIIDESLLTSEDGGLQWAVVSITSKINGGFGLDALKSEAILNQKSCVFEPHVVLVGAGKPLVIVNSDKTLHNIRTVSFMNDAISKAQIAFPGSAVPRDTIVFNEPEIIEAVCDVHGWMKSWIHVVSNPYNAVTDDQGKFELTGIPAGKYTLTVWHETLGEMTQDVTVKEGQSSSVDFYYKK